MVAVPIVLRRLKSKEEEWREAQKVNIDQYFNFICYLKQLYSFNNSIVGFQ